MGKAAKTPTTKKVNIGNTIQIINMSGQDQFCTFTGNVLPKKGFAWQYKDMLFINRRAASDYENKMNPPEPSDEQL